MDSLILVPTRFVSGEDTSLAAANSLEVLLNEAYPDDELVQSTVVELAGYRPARAGLFRWQVEVRRHQTKVRTTRKSARNLRLHTKTAIHGAQTVC
ncbi:hypothetical protein [Mesorhizobium sangaii]|uniref:Uncharacterized protein n=1 Tax=Mesorhizobium sangaii TaxID=505389 RepID=A0A841PQJ4_9HYPH|nr:hypothetical protein [Mesorhizobium sangaii]MBB6412352.1 hypothetical protein [Mesorhizobium sangaii]